MGPLTDRSRLMQLVFQKNVSCSNYCHLFRTWINWAFTVQTVSLHSNNKCFQYCTLPLMYCQLQPLKSLYMVRRSSENTNSCSKKEWSIFCKYMIGLMIFFLRFLKTILDKITVINQSILTKSQPHVRICLIRLLSSLI